MAAAQVSTGSPRMSRKPSPSAKIQDDSEENPKTIVDSFKNGSGSTVKVAPLSVLASEKTSNLQQPKRKDKPVQNHSASNRVSIGGVDAILERLRLNDKRKFSPDATVDNTQKNENAALDKLLNNLQDQNQVLKKQEKEIQVEIEALSKESSRSSGSEASLVVSQTLSMAPKPTTHAPVAVKTDTAEMARVKQELEAAKFVISRQEQELAESRTLKHTMDQAMGPPSEADFGPPSDVSDQAIGHLQSAFNATARPFTSRNETWATNDDTGLDHGDPHGAGMYARSRGIWNSNSTPSMNPILSANAYTDPRGARMSGQNYNGVYGAQGPAADSNYPTATYGSPPSSLGYALRPATDSMIPYTAPMNLRRGSRAAAGLSDHVGTLGGYPTPQGAPIASLGLQNPYAYASRAAYGPPVAPSGSNEFQPGAVSPVANPWPTTLATIGAGINGGIAGQTYVNPIEPMNYRRLLDKSVSCDWKYIVDKIVCNNDQQASIFLQQKLKVGTAEQKFEIVESIVNQAYPLMINRFGNFLVQRCFEHGTPDQVVAIAEAIHGNVLSLSMDPFGCHVIQKAFDSVPEDHKAAMVRELLRRIPDTVIHRYACHVWQKLFELRWSGEPPQIMVKVNEALQGMWHEVALGETGSLVVQNIFENCVEDEKRPAIEEVIANIDLIAHGQFGNWCIQHLCEHGSPPDKRRVVDHILTNSYSYSIDQFASKVVEKCLKISGPEFLDRYLGVITTAHPDRPRIPLIDIAGDQYGNYLIQWILMNTHHHQREQVAIHIRKHMVSLRGSKFGSRVAMLCCNPQSVTRPGQGAVAVNPFGAPGQPRAPWPRFR